jgi:hypothetical protein
MKKPVIDLLPCPFCGSARLQYFNGWPFGSRRKAIAHRCTESETYSRQPSINCLDCDIGFTSGAMAHGITDARCREIVSLAWNRRPQTGESK